MNKERQEMISDEYFKGIKEEAIKLSHIAAEDGFTISDLAVIAIIMRDSASCTALVNKNDS